MGLYPIYTAAEAESSRYLDIYILIVCLHFVVFKNDKIHRPLWVKSTVHLLSGPENCYVQGPMECSLAAGWLFSSLLAERVPTCFHLTFWHQQWPQTLLLQHVSTAF